MKTQYLHCKSSLTTDHLLVRIHIKAKALLLSATVLILINAGCKKDFLDIKPDQALLIPQTLSDFQKLLDNTAIMNVTPALNLISADEFYTLPASLANYLTPQERNSYIWAADRYEGQSISDWNIPYSQIFYANVVLDGLSNLSPADQNSTTGKQIQASALFFRSHAYFQLAQLFCKPYQNANASFTLGLPLHLKSDVNDRPARSTLAETYAQICSDLNAALALLPVNVAQKSRPSKAAACALLAKTYLVMQDYTQALSFSNQAFSYNSKLLNYNTLNASLTTATNPFPESLPNGNDEVIWFASPIGYSFIARTLIVDSTLFRSYDDNDMRKPAYFINRGAGVINVKGTYAGSFGAFTGLANDELYLIRMECKARLNLIPSALDDFNGLSKNRYKTGTYINISESNPQLILAAILKERKKSLIRRGTRWSDLKRLNLDPSTATVLKRKLGSLEYTLPINDPRYTFPIPDDEIRNSGIEQN